MSDVGCQMAGPELTSDIWPPSSVQEHPLHALAERAGEVENVPVRQADAPVRLGLADLGGVGRAVDAVARLRQVDPHEADRIVRSRPDGERVLRFDAFELELGV